MTSNKGNMTTETSSLLLQFAFPRTGKRGVPQQFPRRLYEMLDGETKRNTAAATDDVRHPKLIAWSNSGKAFRIFNVTEFSDVVLPKYFRTKKFSSFQRNLNLYGFTKVRKGVDTDMYAHPSFVRDNPKALLNLQKTSSKNKRDAFTSSSIPSTMQPRSVSPSFSHTIANTMHEKIELQPSMSTNIVVPKYEHHWNDSCESIQCPAPVSPTLPQRRLTICNDSDASSTGSSIGTDRGKLDLLAFALEQEIACFHVH